MRVEGDGSRRCYWLRTASPSGRRPDVQLRRNARINAEEFLRLLFPALIDVEVRVCGTGARGLETLRSSGADQSPGNHLRLIVKACSYRYITSQDAIM